MNQEVSSYFVSFHYTARERDISSVYKGFSSFVTEVSFDNPSSEEDIWLLERKCKSYLIEGHGFHEAAVTILYFKALG